MPTTVTVALSSGVNPVPEKPMPSFLSAMSSRLTCASATVACGVFASGTAESF